jgi:MFS family permease
MKRIAQPVSAVQFGALTTIEMATAVLIYIPVAWLADRGSKKPFVLTTFVLFTCFPLVLMFCQNFEWLVPAFVVRGLKEFGEPTRKALIVEFSPETHRAACLACTISSGTSWYRSPPSEEPSLGDQPADQLRQGILLRRDGTIFYAIWGKDERG